MCLKANAGDYKGALAIYEQTLESILVLTKGQFPYNAL